MSKLIIATGSIRLPFLMLTFACILLGTGIVIHNGNELDTGLAAVVLLAALSAHASVNLFNEYFDFRSGLDLKTVKTPFSGGSGTLPNHPEAAGMVLMLAILTLVITSTAGLYLVYLRGMPLFALGLGGVIIILVYTHWINRWPWICLLAPGLAFGPIMIIGTEIALTGHFTTAGAIASLIPFFVVNNLLLLNQVPDIEADKTVGRKHFPIKYGLEKTYQMHKLLGALAIISVIAGYISDLIPVFSLIAILPMAINLRDISRENLPARMQFNVMTSITAPALMAGPMLF